MEMCLRVLSMIFFVLFRTILIKGIQLSDVRGQQCVQPVLRVDNGGLIQSHKMFGISPYPNNMDCEWIILAPSGYQIMIQFNFLDIEVERTCLHDFLSFSNSFNHSTQVCGDDDRNRIILNGNKLIVHFHTNSVGAYEGFLFRYLFVLSSEVSKGLVSFLKYRPSCLGNEWKCTFGNTCIPKNWLCDYIRDCRDNSDESYCIIFRSCHQSQIRCSIGGCISKELICNGIKECEDGSDEMNCNSTLLLPDPFKSNGINKCSFQSILPDYVDKTDDNSQIVGGHESIPGSWPWMITLNFASFHLCGASLISELWAVSAGHCFIDYKNPDKWIVELGRHYLNYGKSQNHQVEKIVVHPKFDIGLVDYDIALIKLKTPVTFTNSIQTVCLPETSQEPIPGKRCVILGWGYTNGTGREGILNQAVVPIVDRKTCVKDYNYIITDQMICAGYENGGIDACNGDSGGSLVCKNGGKFVLYGISSWGVGCAQPNKPGVYSNVVKFVKWIKETILETEASFSTRYPVIKNSSKGISIQQNEVTYAAISPTSKHHNDIIVSSSSPTINSNQNCNNITLALKVLLNYSVTTMDKILLNSQLTTEKLLIISKTSWEKLLKMSNFTEQQILTNSLFISKSMYGNYTSALKTILNNSKSTLEGLLNIYKSISTDILNHSMSSLEKILNNSTSTLQKLLHNTESFINNIIHKL